MAFASFVLIFPFCRRAHFHTPAKRHLRDLTVVAMYTGRQLAEAALRFVLGAFVGGEPFSYPVVM